MAKCCFWFKIVSLSLFCALNIYLFVVSWGVNYQYELTKEHIKFRESMPTMDSWVNSPFGKLKSYVFNVTNAEEFLSGRDKKIRFEQIGPITYYIKGYNDVLNRTDSSITYRKHRYRHVTFLPDESVSPDILNKTIVQFNSILIGAAAKSAKIPMAFLGFNPLTISEPVFLSNSIYYFLWEVSNPALDMASKWMPLATNCGPLYNALQEKEEVFTVNIGPEHGVDNFFRIQSLNDELLIKEQRKRGSFGHIPEDCPINVENTLDNSLFPPFVTRETPLNIMASESCRVIPLHYQRDEEYYGMNGYRYVLLRPNETAPECLSRTNGVKLPLGMFDVSACVINDAPAAFSAPHFFGSSYDWTQHYEGLNPNAEEHEAFILLEPTTGIPLNEKYRFQSNTVMPNMFGYTRIQKLSNMVVPTFWYEFEMGVLPDIVLFLMRMNVVVMPVLQPVLMGLQLLCALWSLYALIRLLKRCEPISEGRLETVFNSNPNVNPKPQQTSPKVVK